MAARLLATCGLAVVGVGVFFIAFRPPLLPEDRRYIAAPGQALDEVLPGLGRWLQKVFWVMEGYMVATGILTIHLALSGVRDGSPTAWIFAAAAGAAWVGLMAAVNVVLRSDFRWPCWVLLRCGRSRRSRSRGRLIRSDDGRTSTEALWGLPPMPRQRSVLC